MMKRKIIRIEEDKCNGCALCIPNCPEGALKIIDGKVRLISDLFCDGLGACIGHCPTGAITIEERDAEKYDEKKVMENIIRQGANMIKAHLEHLRDHNETGYLKEALEVLNKKGLANPIKEATNEHKHFAGCPGSRMMDLTPKTNEAKSTAPDDTATRNSELRQWPVQLHLVSPTAPYFQGKDVLLAADCTAYSLGDFHKDYLKGKSLAIACPKLDNNQEIYLEKLTSMIDDAKINTLTVLTMEVPCCGGLLHMAKKAVNSSKRKIPVKSIVASLHGEILKEEWI